MAKTKKVPKHIQDRVNAKLQECLEIAEQRFGRKFKFPKVRYDKRGTTAGTAHFRDWAVNFNAILLVENEDAFIARTVPHELAHLIDYKVHPENFRCGYGRKRSVHGPTWKRIMMMFGADPSRCHSYDVSKAKVKEKTKHQYECKTCKSIMTVGPVRHRKIQRGVAQYRLRGCAHHEGYKYLGVKSKQQQDVAANASKPKPKNRASHNRGTSKLAACRDLYSAVLSREENIRSFISVGCTPAGAASYYAKIKKEMGH